jgi:hypothetical protein
MAIASRADLVPEMVDHTKPRFQMEALIRNASNHEVVVTFVGFNLDPKHGDALTIGNAEPVPPAQPISQSSGFVLPAGVGQIFYVNLPSKDVKRWLRPGTKATVYARTSDGREWFSRPIADFSYSG